MYLVPPQTPGGIFFFALNSFWQATGGTGIKNTDLFWLCWKVEAHTNLVLSLTLWFLPAEGTELCLIDMLNLSQCISASAIFTHLLVQDSSVLAPFPHHADIDLHFILFFFFWRLQQNYSEVFFFFWSIIFFFIYNKKKKVALPLMAKWPRFRTLMMNMSN